MGEGTGGELRGTGLGLFQMADTEAPVAHACPCQVLRAGPSQPPTATT